MAAIIRVLLSLLFGTLLLFRLDQNIMMDGFKFADRGEKNYGDQPFQTCIII